jgi:hypothetical protein
MLQIYSRYEYHAAHLETIFSYIFTHSSHLTFFYITLVYHGAVVAQLVEALRYKLEGRGFDS